MGSLLMNQEAVFVHAEYITRVAFAIAFAILYYDFFLTLGEELERFWKRPTSIYSYGFFLNRYLSLFGHVPVFVEIYLSHHQSLCLRLQMYHQLLAGITQIVVGCLQMFRVYALYNCSRNVLFSLIGLASVCCLVSAWAIRQIWHAFPAYEPSQLVLDHVSQYGCDFITSDYQGVYLAGIWATILVFDGAVFGLTLRQVLRVGKKWRGSLFTLILRDGMFYFGVLLIFHTLNILTSLLAQSVHRAITVTITNVIATSLIGRLMLNIRDPELRQATYEWPSDGSVA